MVNVFTKKLRFHLLCEAEPYLYCQFSIINFQLFTTYRFTVPCKVKVKTVIICERVTHCYYFNIFAAKV